MTADVPEVLGALADEPRLRVFAAVVLGARDTPTVAARAGVPPREALRALTRLESAGLVGRDDAGWAAHAGRLRAAAATATPTPAYVDHGASDPGEAAVLRTFLPEGRLTRMPAQHAKRMVVLDHIARVFEPGVRYPEREVDALLRVFDAADHVTIRRYLVDYGFLTREAGAYWRTGGTVAV